MRLAGRAWHTGRATAAQAVERARAVPKMPLMRIHGTGYMGMVIWGLFNHNSHPGEFYREFQTG